MSVNCRFKIWSKVPLLQTHNHQRLINIRLTLTFVWCRFFTERTPIDFVRSTTAAISATLKVTPHLFLSPSHPISAVLTPSSTPSCGRCACCSSMCDWWRSASFLPSATQHSSVPKAPLSFSLTCRHQMAHHLPPTVNKSCNYPSCPTKGNSLSFSHAWGDIQRSNTHRKVNSVSMHIITHLRQFFNYSYNVLLIVICPSLCKHFQPILVWYDNVPFSTTWITIRIDQSLYALKQGICTFIFTTTQLSWWWVEQDLLELQTYLYNLMMVIILS